MGNFLEEWLGGFPGGSVGKESTCNAGDKGDVGSVPRLGRSLGGGQGNPLQYSCLEDPMERGAWQAAVHEVARIRHDFVTKLPSGGQNTRNDIFLAR